MGCLNCNTELKHTPGKRKKQFCSPDCRVRYWQKNKPKKEPPTDVLDDLIDIRKEQDVFCKRSGFPTSQFIERFEQLEAKNGELLKKIKWLEAENITLSNTNTNISIEVDSLKGDAATWRLRMAQTTDAIQNAPATVTTTTSTGPITAPQTEKEGKITPKQVITQEEAEKRLKKRYDQLPGFLKPENDGKEAQKGIEQAKSNTKELSPFLKSRQNLKNGIK